MVYFNPEKVKAKNLEKISASEIHSAFSNNRIEVFDDAARLEGFLLSQKWKNKNLLMMSSGNFGGINLRQLTDKILA